MKYECPLCHKHNIEQKKDKYYCDDCKKLFTSLEIIRIITINKNAKNGQHVCPNCGASEILFDDKEKSLQCKYCGCLFKEKGEDDNKIKSLKGVTKGKGSTNIDVNFNNIVTIKCEGCGAEVVINTEDNTVARCQWCRSVLALDDIVESGLNPDKILPFELSKEEALKKMKDYLKGDNGSYANINFKNNLSIDNIIGVYMPYLIVDVNAHVKLEGIGKHLTKNKNIEEYKINREYDLYVDDLALESNSSRKNLENEKRADNIINAVMPFDTENALKFTSNYLIGYNAEKRDLNKEDLMDDFNKKISDISETLLKKDQIFYDKGVKWNNSKYDVVGSKWLSIYLPIWLYSYQEKGKNGEYLHYIAVNGRTGKVIGSIPVDDNKAKRNSLITTFAFLCILVPFMFLINSIVLNLFNSILLYLIVIVLLPILLSILIYKTTYHYLVKYYRNKKAKFNYEKKTKKSFSNIIKDDMLIKKYKE